MQDYKAEDQPLPARKRRASKSEWLAQFWREEDGVVVGFAIFLFLIILMVGGIGVDVMHSEMKRTRLQHTLDRAILAAADLDQTREPNAVVQDYFEKAGMTDYLSDVTVRDGLNFREVEAAASSQHDTMFMKMVGVETLSVPASGTAVERIGNLEISLVLDVSGSMGSNSRLTNLKVAAKDFVQAMSDNTEDGTLSVSIIPYATQVAVPNNLFETLNASTTGDVDVDTALDTGAADAASNQHGYSRCIHFESSDFASTELNPGDRWKQAVHFSPWSDFDGRDNDPKELVSSPVCRTDSGSEVLVLEDDVTTLKNYIDGLWASGNTSIDLGMKWGTALLDPSTQDVIDHMIDNDNVSNDFSGRPYEYDDAESLKVVVLMTDGKNTSQYYVHDNFRDGDSNIWWNDEEEKYSVYIGTDHYDDNDNGEYDDDLYYWPFDDTWSDHPYGNGEITSSEWIEHVETYCKRYNSKKGECKKWGNRTTYEEVITTVSEDGEAVRLQYPDLWAYTSLEWNVEEHYEPWMNDSQAWDDWYYDVRKYVGSSTKNTRTKSICDAAKDENIIVFTIGFEAPDSGQAVLQDCASSDSHYFDVDGLEIRDAFAAIATSIRQLRLTQ
ncbi:TadE/TadG family type IV pilus assembly protein [Shimia abyssi]|uniref:Flp pilus assembly protein TadG n=1 Tax=Shimia abyssi TaxID=1662395 RepID=A0A2P8FE86_9RHOB|nr:TadE/TadG family type IV pilus assembly protein [Shimia abyssi]PSL20031.1 Flp pilus assembly protein TadG [Shimia abyssi]